MQKRTTVISLGFLVAFVAIIVRLFYWQVIKGAELSDQARNQYQSGTTLQAPRGSILASDYTPLAGKVEAWLVYASLDKFTSSPRVAADKLAPYFVNKDYETTEERKQAILLEIDRLDEQLSRDGVVWVPLRHKIDSETKEAIGLLEIEGIGFERQETRVYPEGSSAAQLLGFVGKSEEGGDVGYFGLEGYYDLMLSGKEGYVSRESDVRGVPILLSEAREVGAVGGVDLITHIEKSIQFNLDKKLTSGIEKYGAKAGSAIIMNPKNGAILAMSSYPSYDPLSYTQYSDSEFRNPVVSDSFEPGSIFKVLVMAAALDADVVEPDTKCEICAGPLRVDKYTISTWNNEYNADATMADVIVHSDNVGMAYVGGELGADTLYDYLDAFGVGKLTKIDLQGESTPNMRARGTWNIVDLATTSFGQGIATTPIQIISAVSTIANNGIPTTPQVIDKLAGIGWEEDIEPQKRSRVISESTAGDITAMMVEAAASGEAKWTHLGGFNVAGKTGTAQIPISGHYDEEKTIASFVGFAPADDPEFIMLVTLREPETSPWASETAAPLWYSIARDLFLHFGIQPKN